MTLIVCTNFLPFSTRFNEVRESYLTACSQCSNPLMIWDIHLHAAVQIKEDGSIAFSSASPTGIPNVPHSSAKCLNPDRALQISLRHMLIHFVKLLWWFLSLATGCSGLHAIVSSRLLLLVPYNSSDQNQQDKVVFWRSLCSTILSFRCCLDHGPRGED